MIKLPKVGSHMFWFKLFQTLKVHELLRTKAIQSSHTFARDNVNGLLNRGPAHLKVPTNICDLKQLMQNNLWHEIIRVKKNWIVIGL